MNYTFLFRTAFKANYHWEQQVQSYMGSHLPNFIHFTDIHAWFGGDDWVTMEKINEVFDVKNTPELSIIACVLNPYARMFNHYLSFTAQSPTEELYNTDKFQYFIEHELDNIPERFKTVLISTQKKLYTFESLKPTYIVKVENFVEDLSKLPMFESLPKFSGTAPILNLKDDYRNFYNDYTRKFVEDLYNEDLIEYGYSF